MDKRLFNAGLSSGRFSRVAGLVRATKDADRINIEGADGRALDWTIQTRRGLDEPKRPQQMSAYPPPPPSPSTCCLYPWPDPLGSPLYPPEDLPDQITVNGETWNRDPLMAGGYGYQGVSGGIDALSTGLGWRFLDEDGNEIAFTEQSPTECFIGFYIITADGGILMQVADLFSDTYTVNGIDTVTRTNLCTWTGPKSGGGTWTLQYDSSSYVWKLNGVAKTAPQSSPAGTFGSDTVA